jgi:hypothetical protein
VPLDLAVADVDQGGNVGSIVHIDDRVRVAAVNDHVGLDQIDVPSITDCVA